MKNNSLIIMIAIVFAVTIAAAHGRESAEGRDYGCQ